LNNLLAGERENYSALEKSFNKYEASQSALLSSKNGEIAEKDREIAKLKLDKKGADGQRNIAVVIATALALALVAIIYFRRAV
jgi:hypothetical protein